MSSRARACFGAIAIGVNCARRAARGLRPGCAGKRVAGFWAALRTGQALIIVEAVTGAALLLDGKDLPRLHLIYGLVPIAVAFVAEQLRLDRAPRPCSTSTTSKDAERGRRTARVRAARAGRS